MSFSAKPESKKKYEIPQIKKINIWENNELQYMQQGLLIATLYLPTDEAKSDFEKAKTFVDSKEHEATRIAHPLATAAILFQLGLMLNVHPNLAPNQQVIYYLSAHHIFKNLKEIDPESTASWIMLLIVLAEKSEKNGNALTLMKLAKKLLNELQSSNLFENIKELQQEIDISYKNLHQRISSSSPSASAATNTTTSSSSEQPENKKTHRIPEIKNMRLWSSNFPAFTLSINLMGTKKDSPKFKQLIGKATDFTNNAQNIKASPHAVVHLLYLMGEATSSNSKFSIFKKALKILANCDTIDPEIALEHLKMLIVLAIENKNLSRESKTELLEKAKILIGKIEDYIKTNIKDLIDPSIYMTGLNHLKRNYERCCQLLKIAETKTQDQKTSSTDTLSDSKKTPLTAFSILSNRPRKPLVTLQSPLPRELVEDAHVLRANHKIWYPHRYKSSA